MAKLFMVTEKGVTAAAKENIGFTKGVVSLAYNKETDELFTMDCEFCSLPPCDEEGWTPFSGTIQQAIDNKLIVEVSL